MSIPQSNKSAEKKLRRRFQEFIRGKLFEMPEVEIRDQDEWLPQILSETILDYFARHTGALDVRNRKLNCKRFFWMVLAQVRPGGPGSLGSMVEEWASNITNLGDPQAIQAAMISRQAISENYQVRPWQFFEAVYGYLLQVYQRLKGSRKVNIKLKGIEEIKITDATVMRVANNLIQSFPGHRTGPLEHWAAIKMHSCLSLSQGLVEVIAITSEKVHEKGIDFRVSQERNRLYVMDLGYWKYAIFDRILDNQQHFVTRYRLYSNPLILDVYQGRADWKGLRLKSIQPEGEVIDLCVHLPCESSPAHMKHTVRLVGMVVDGEWRWYITSLGDRKAFPPDLIALIYALRWEIEILFRNLKHVLRIQNFISTSENGVRIQIYGAMIFYIVSQLLMLRAARSIGSSPETFSVVKSVRMTGKILTRFIGPVLKVHSSDAGGLESLSLTLIALLGKKEKRSKPCRIHLAKSTCLSLC